VVKASSGNASPFLEANAVSAGGGFAIARLSEGTGDGSAGNMGYDLRYSVASAYFTLFSRDTDGSSTNADVIRVPDGQLTVDGNSTFDASAFDYVCEDCGWHGPEKVEACPECGCLDVQWHDDVALIAQAVKSQKVQDIPDKTLRRMEKLGIIKVDRDELLHGKPQVFLSWNRCHWYTWAGMAQMAQRIEELERKVA